MFYWNMELAARNTEWKRKLFDKQFVILEQTFYRFLF